jgi:hypothetical protein
MMLLGICEPRGPAISMISNTIKTAVYGINPSIFYEDLFKPSAAEEEKSQLMKTADDPQPGLAYDDLTAALGVSKRAAAGQHSALASHLKNFIR